MTLLWSSLALPLFQQSTAETAIDHYKKDLRQVTENARELISCVDAVQDSATISQAVVGSQPVICHIESTLFARASCVRSLP